MRSKVISSSYLDIYFLRHTLDKEKYLNNLLCIFFEDEENFFIFNLIRNTIKKSLKEGVVPLGEEWIFKRFGIQKRFERSKPKLAFIDHSFHCKTASSMFFIYELEKQFDVDIFWSLQWKGVPEKYLAKLHTKYDNIVYWQIFPDPSLKYTQNILLVPMWDSIYSESDLFFEKYKKFNFLSFSESLHKRVRSFGINSEYIKVIPYLYDSQSLEKKRYKKENKVEKPPVLYFWQRTNDITWSVLKKILKGNIFSKIYICKSVDPGVTFDVPTHQDIEKYNIEIFSWENDRVKFINRLIESDIYVAPRKIEGIGFSFIEAIEFGCTVICNDASTMNEYIDNSVGYLVNYDKPSPIDLSDWVDKKEKIKTVYTCDQQGKSLFAEKLSKIFREVFK